MKIGENLWKLVKKPKIVLKKVSGGYVLWSYGYTSIVKAICRVRISHGGICKVEN